MDLAKKIGKKIRESIWTLITILAGNIIIYETTQEAGKSYDWGRLISNTPFLILLGLTIISLAFAIRQDVKETEKDKESTKPFVVNNGPADPDKSKVAETVVEDALDEGYDDEEVNTPENSPATPDDEKNCD